MHFYQQGFNSGMQGWFLKQKSINIILHVNRKTHNHLIRCRIYIWQRSHIIKNALQTRNRRELSQPDKRIQENLRDNIIHYGLRINALIYKIMQKKRCFFSLLFNILLEILTTQLSKKKIKKNHPYWKEEIKLFLFTDDDLCRKSYGIY